MRVEAGGTRSANIQLVGVRSWLLALGAALIGLFCGCQKKEGLAVPFVFRDVTREAGVEKVTSTYAIATADFDKNGFPDLAISNHHLAPFSIFRNQGNGTFEEVQTSFRVPDTSPIGDQESSPTNKTSKRDTIDIHGITWWNFDDDEYLDLLLATGGTRANHVLRNIDGVRFEQIEIDPRIAGPGDRARTIVPMILDGGGDALCLLNHGPGPKSRLLRRWGSKIEDWSSRSGVDRVRASQLVGLHIDESGRSFYFGSRNPKFVAYELTRSGELIDVTSLLGFSNVGQVNSIAVGDYDNDGDQDIYAGCGLSGILAGCQQYRGDVVFKLDLWKKQGMRFRTEGQIEIGYVLQTSDTRGNNYDPSLIRLGRSKQTIPALPYRLDVNDHRLEGKPDMLGAAVFLYRNESGDLILKASLESKQLAQQRLSGIIRCSAPVRIQETWNFGRNPREFVNKLWQNRDGKFVNVTKQAGVGDAGICQDSLFADFDNDGDLDLYVVNGGRLVGNSANVFYRNNGNGTFTDVTEQADLSGPEIGRGNAAVAIDFDQDGDLDLFSVNGHGPPLVFSREETVTKLRLFSKVRNGFGPYRLWENETDGGESFSVDLIGSASGPLALGTRVVARFGGKTLVRERNACNGVHSTSILPLYFGLGDSQTAEITVYWASGKVTQHFAKAGENLELYEP